MDANSISALLKEGSRLLGLLLEQPVDVAGGIAADELSYWRWRNRIHILDRVQRIAEARGIPIQKPSRQFSLMWLNDAGLIEEEVLQQLWAELLVSAMHEKDGEHPSFIDTLKRLGPHEALVLKALETPVRIRGHLVEIETPVPVDMLRVTAFLSAAGLVSSEQLTQHWTWEDGPDFALTYYAFEFAAAVGVAIDERLRPAARLSGD